MFALNTFVIKTAKLLDALAECQLETSALDHYVKNLEAVTARHIERAARLVTALPVQYDPEAEAAALRGQRTRIGTYGQTEPERSDIRQPITGVPPLTVAWAQDRVEVVATQNVGRTNDVSIQVGNLHFDMNSGQKAQGRTPELQALTTFCTEVAKSAVAIRQRHKKEMESGAPVPDKGVVATDSDGTQALFEHKYAELGTPELDKNLRTLAIAEIMQGLNDERVPIGTPTYERRRRNVQAFVAAVVDDDPVLPLDPEPWAEVLQLCKMHKQKTQAIRDDWDAIQQRRAEQLAHHKTLQELGDIESLVESGAALMTLWHENGDVDRPFTTPEGGAPWAVSHPLNYANDLLTYWASQPGRPIALLERAFTHLFAHGSFRDLARAAQLLEPIRTNYGNAEAASDDDSRSAALNVRSGVDLVTGLLAERICANAIAVIDTLGVNDWHSSLNPSTELLTHLVLTSTTAGQTELAEFCARQLTALAKKTVDSDIGSDGTINRCVRDTFYALDAVDPKAAERFRVSWPNPWQADSRFPNAPGFTANRLGITLRTAAPGGGPVRPATPTDFASGQTTPGELSIRPPTPSGVAF